MQQEKEGGHNVTWITGGLSLSNISSHRTNRKGMGHGGQFFWNIARVS